MDIIQTFGLLNIVKNDNLTINYFATLLPQLQATIKFNLEKA